MATAQDQSRESAPRQKKSDGLGSGGYTDKPWFLRCWDGMIATGWFPMLVRNYFHISPRRWAMALLMSLFSLLNFAALAAANAPLGPANRSHATPGGSDLCDRPLAIRHDAAARIARARPATYLPKHLRLFLSQPFSAHGPRFPATAGRSSAQATAHGQHGREAGTAHKRTNSPCAIWACVRRIRRSLFPITRRRTRSSSSSRTCRRGERARWQNGMMWFLKCLTVRTPKRIVLKSPPHTFRIKILLEMFPKARFIHIIRNPFVIFPSTINLWKRLYRNDGLQMPTYEGLDEQVFETFTRMYDVFERDRSLIPRGPNLRSALRGPRGPAAPTNATGLRGIEAGRIRDGATPDGSLFREKSRLQDQSLSTSARIGNGNQPPLGELLRALRLRQGTMLALPARQGKRRLERNPFRLLALATYRRVGGVGADRGAMPADHDRARIT